MRGCPSGGGSDGVGGAGDQGGQVINAEVRAQLSRVLGAFDDLAGEMHGVSVLVDPFSSQYIRGALVDFSDSLTGGGFKISNPNASQSCGCGKSFTAQAK